MACEHTKTRVLYQQLPKSQGRRLDKVKARVCAACGAIL